LLNSVKLRESLKKIFGKAMGKAESVLAELGKARARQVR
jgi:hypothetical protein